MKIGSSIKLNHTIEETIIKLEKKEQVIYKETRRKRKKVDAVTS
jgi:hypothetical protein